MIEKDTPESIALQHVIVAVALQCHNGIPSLLGKTKAPEDSEIICALMRQYPERSKADVLSDFAHISVIGFDNLSKACREFSKFSDTRADWNVFKQSCLYSTIKGGYMNNGGYARIAENNGMSPVRARRVAKRLPRQIARLVLSGLSLFEDLADPDLAQN